MARVAIYPGSFDPVTYGHLDIIRRTVKLFDGVVVAVAQNISKPGLFTAEERVELIRQVMGDDGGKIEVDLFSGLLVDYVRRRGATSIVRGLRAVADFEYEFQLALMNRRLENTVDTVFLMTDERYFYISSSLVKEVARFGGDVSEFVPEQVEQALRERYAQP